MNSKLYSLVTPWSTKVLLSQHQHRMICVHYLKDNVYKVIQIRQRKHLVMLNAFKVHHYHKDNVYKNASQHVNPVRVEKALGDVKCFQSSPLS